MKCPSCLAECPDDSTFCGKCGSRLDAEAQASYTRTLASSREELTKGATLAGRYLIIEELGRGGMGKVYRAEDTSLSRHVAIKVLPEDFSGDPERLARFEREAKLLAQLNHPHIAIVHGLESHEGRRFLVMELVEGRPLADRLKSGRLSTGEAIRICRQIAEGLESAHAKGIVHRDLKPANVMVTPEGKVKILDFGLAKACESASGAGSSARHPTGSDSMTAPGLILGTVLYMSPEQASGRTLDRRTDIWSFACIVFECLTGRRAFQGESVSETLAAILKGEPDWARLPADAPIEVQKLLRRCFRKDPGRRLHDIADARIVLEGEADLPPAAVSTPSRRPLKPATVSAIGAAALVIGALAGALLIRGRGAGPASPTSGTVVSSIDLVPGQRLGGLSFLAPYRKLPTRTELAVSSRGDFIVYSAVAADADPAGASRIYLRRLDRLEAEPVAGTEGGVMPFLSPDDGWIGFWSDGYLKKVPVDGGLPMTLCEAALPFGFSWGDDDRIVFSPNRDCGLYLVPAGGGTPVLLTEPEADKEEFSHRLPHVLPGGAHALFTITRHAWDPKPRIAVLELATGRWHDLLEDGADARFVRPGHLVFLRLGVLMAVPFDLMRLEVAGSPAPAVAGISQALHSTNSRYETGAGQFSVSPSGTLVYAAGGIDPDRRDFLVWVDAGGAVEQEASFRAPFFAIRISPDGRRIAYSRLGMEYEIWIRDLERGTDTKMTSGGMAEFPVWTPDGKRLVFDWVEVGVPNLFWQPVDGSAPMERLTTSAHFQYPSSMTPDGETLAFVEETAETGRDIHLLNMRDRSVESFLESADFEAYPEFSPDGKWIAYVTNESGREEVYVRPFPDGRGRWQISHQGGTLPVWAPDGKRLYYQCRSRIMSDEVWVYDVWAVDIETRAGFAPGKPLRLMELVGYARGTPVRCWDISPDGRRFITPKFEENTFLPITELVLVLNWSEELRRLGAMGK